MARGALVEDHRDVDVLLAGMRRIAVLGIKPESRADQPAHMISAYLQRHGYQLVPVPVHHPDVTEILGTSVVRNLGDIAGRIDVLNVFRKPADLMPHLDTIIAARPRAVWLQTGIRHEGFAKALLEAGIDVVQDQCLMVEHRRWKSG